MAESSVGSNRFDRLLDELLAARRGGEQVLEALTLARLPTESERLSLAVYLKAAPDRPAAWRQVLATLTATQEFREHAAALPGREELGEDAAGRKASAPAGRYDRPAGATAFVPSTKAARALVQLPWEGPPWRLWSD